MRCRFSAVANRSALHSDYYTGKKITVTPLNFVCKCRRPRFDPTRDKLVEPTQRERIFRLRFPTTKNPHIAKTPMNCGFLLTFDFCRRRHRQLVAQRLRASFAARKRLTRQILQCEKNYAPDAFTGVLRARATRKTRESVSTDSIRAPFSAVARVTLHRRSQRSHVLFSTLVKREKRLRRRHGTAPFRCRCASSGVR
jgi:hypothetical protein